MKRALEAFGVASGLFDELDIKSPLGSSANEPFQIQIRKLGSRLKGPLRNLTDVGYGVSQALPLITELLRPDDAPPLFLFQQPEVHLHPRAQAALGTLFCATLSDRRQVVVETHSDYLVNRVRMEVREGTVSPKDVSILYFERNEIEVQIHSISLDEQGNLLNAPPSYGAFFMAEMERSLAL